LSRSVANIGIVLIGSLTVLFANLSLAILGWGFRPPSDYLLIVALFNSLIVVRDELLLPPRRTSRLYRRLQPALWVILAAGSYLAIFRFLVDSNSADWILTDVFANVSAAVYLLSVLVLLGQDVSVRLPPLASRLASSISTTLPRILVALYFVALLCLPAAVITLLTFAIAGIRADIETVASVFGVGLALTKLARDGWARASTRSANTRAHEDR
jgi:hypothetical protein